MQIEHCGVQVAMAEHDLKVADEGTILQGVRGERVAQVVRSEAMQVAADSGGSDRSLDV